MRPLKKTFCAIALAQGVCLALGLWIQDRYLSLAEEWTVHEQVWTELESITAGMRRELPQQVDLRSPESPGYRQVETLASSLIAGGQVNALVTDPEWRVILSPVETAAAEVLPPTGETVSWRNCGPVAHDGKAPQRGLLMLGGVSQPALAFALPDARGYLLVSSRTHADTAAIGSSQTFMAALLAFVWICGLQCIVAFLILSRIHGEHSRWQVKTDEEMLRRTQDLLRTRDAVIFGLAKLAESRDPETGQHLERISLYSTRLAAELRKYPKYREVVTPAFVRMIGISSALHDIGKVGIEDAILLKPGKLTNGERYSMQMHSLIGGECLREIERRLANSNFLDMAREIALFHHERWDGNGYPHGLAGEEIPLAARIVAIADVYDALSVRRVYKPALPHTKCVSIIREEAGKQFDPDLVAVFLTIEAQFREIARQFADDSSASKSEQPAAGSTLRTADHRPQLTPEQETLLMLAGQPVNEPISSTKTA